MVKTGLKFAAALAVSLSFGAVAARADVLADVKKAGELKVGTETEFAPFDFIDSGDHVGLNVDFFEALGKELGVKISWVALPWEGVLPGLESKKFDMVAGPAIITKARLERYVFSSPIAEATVALIKRKTDASITKPEDVAGKSVGGGRASSQLAQLKSFAATLSPPATVREYTGANETMADLSAGRIVAAVASYPNAAYAAQKRPDAFEVVMPPFGQKVYFGYIGRKDPDSASLIKAIDEAIAKMGTDGRMAALQKKWFGIAFDTPASVGEPAL